MSDDQKSSYTFTIPGLAEFAEKVRNGPAIMREQFDRALLKQMEQAKADGKLDPWGVSKLIELRQKYPMEEQP